MRVGFAILSGVLSVWSMAIAAGSPCSAATSPFDPLSESEIAAATQIVSASRLFPKGALFPVVALHEPAKAKVLARESALAAVTSAASTAGGASLPLQTVLQLSREAEVVILDRAANRMIATVVDLDAKKVVEWTPLPGRQPLVLMEEYETVPAIVRADARWQAAMRRRGISDFSKVWVDTWATGSFAPAGQEGARLLRAVSYFQDGMVNFYGRPIEGVTAVVNLNTRKVVEVLDTQAYPVPPEKLELDAPPAGVRGLKPLTIAQPDGPSFTVDGQQVTWQGWSLRWAMHPREGLVVYDVGFDDPFDASGQRRVLYRAALSEMVVPYGDTDAHWVWRNAFDEGEYGVGRLASPIDPAVDAPPNARLFDAVFADDFGKPYTLPRAVGLYERDAGLLWKHYDIYNEKNSARRARQLVLFFIATIGNYDYAIQWIFHQDGMIEVTCDLTGIMLVKGAADADLADASAHQHAHRVAPNLVAPHHQHFFNFRLDFDVDGVANSVSEHNTSAAPPGPENPGNNGIEMHDSPLATESAAQRDLQLSSARVWRIGDNSRHNALGYAPSYLLLPTGNAVPYLSADSTVRRRARFVDHHFWATRYHEGERHAAGWYPNQGPEGEGLPAYVTDDESLVQQDVVVWYTVGITHVPRPEEWPIMSVHQVGFKLAPAGFFVRNPSFEMPGPAVP